MRLEIVLACTENRGVEGECMYVAGMTEADVPHRA